MSEVIERTTSARRLETLRAPFVQEPSASVGEFTGYASVFDSRIMASEKGPTIIRRGAFARTIRERGDRVRILWQHDEGEPIGRPRELREDTRGLFVRGVIADTPRGRDSVALMANGALVELSIGFVAIESHYEDIGGERFRAVTELELFEISLVTFAADPAARIVSAKPIPRPSPPPSHHRAGPPNPRDTKIRDLRLRDAQIAQARSRMVPAHRAVHHRRGR